MPISYRFPTIQRRRPLQYRDRAVVAARTHVAVSETGGSPFAVRIEAGSHVFIGDEPLVAGGADLGPSPFQLLCAALAECTAMTIRWYARSLGWPVEQVQVSVDHQKKMLVGSSAIVDVFEKTIVIRGTNLREDQVAQLLEAAGKCPVQRTLEGAPNITAALGTAADPASLPMSASGQKD